MNTSSHLQQQGSPILLLADLLRRFPQLPAATFQIDNLGAPLLTVSIHREVRSAFEPWRQALGLPGGEVRSWGQHTWVAAAGRCADVRVELHGYGTPDEVAAVVELAEAVALLGALPMPTGCPSPGELAEQQHLIDPLDHVLEHLADEKPAPGACAECGESSETWCPDCGCCRLGCFGGHEDNSCTHANAPWAVSRG